MSQERYWDDQGLPDWLQEAIREAERIPDSELERYSYMKDDFIAAIRKAAEAGRQGAPQDAVDAVFSLAGKLLAWAEKRVVRLLPEPPPDLAYGFGARAFRDPEIRRGGEAVRSPGEMDGTRDPNPARPGGSERSWMGVARELGPVRVEAIVHSGKPPELEIRVLDARDGSDIRPLDVVVFDADERRLLVKQHSSHTESSPRFPGPQEGTYDVRISWPSGSETVTIRFDK